MSCRVPGRDCCLTFGPAVLKGSQPNLEKIMKHQNRLLAFLLAAFFALLPASLFAQGSVRILFTFDYPGGGTSTSPFGINQGGDITGYYLDSAGVTRGFTRYRDGSFSAPIVEPNDTANFTQALGINSAQTVVGNFITSADNTDHGFFLSGGVFTQFDFGGPVSTNIMNQ